MYGKGETKREGKKRKEECEWMQFRTYSLRFQSGKSTWEKNLKEKERKTGKEREMKEIKNKRKGSRVTSKWKSLVHLFRNFTIFFLSKLSPRFSTLIPPWCFFNSLFSYSISCSCYILRLFSITSVTPLLFLILILLFKLASHLLSLSFYFSPSFIHLFFSHSIPISSLICLSFQFLPSTFLQCSFLVVSSFPSIFLPISFFLYFIIHSSPVYFLLIHFLLSFLCPCSTFFSNFTWLPIFSPYYVKTILYFVLNTHFIIPIYSLLFFSSFSLFIFMLFLLSFQLLPPLGFLSHSSFSVTISPLSFFRISFLVFLFIVICFSSTSSS